MPIALAAAAAICFASAGVSIKRSLAGNPVVMVLLISLPVVVLGTGLFTLFDRPENVTLASMVWFVVGGLAGDGIARAAYMGGVERLGVSRATPFQTAAYPALALIGGVLFFSESVTLLRIAAAASIVSGIWAVVATDYGDGGGVGSETRWKWHWAYMFPVVAGLAFALADLFRKVALEDTPSPAFGAMVGAGTATVVWAIVIFVVPGFRKQVSVGPGWQWIVLAGAFIAIGLIAVFNALETGDVSVVGPIIVAQPLIVVVLSAVFLREHEVVTWRTAVGAGLTVLGVVLLAIDS